MIVFLARFELFSLKCCIRELFISLYIFVGIALNGCDKKKIIKTALTTIK